MRQPWPWTVSTYKLNLSFLCGNCRPQFREAREHERDTRLSVSAIRRFLHKSSQSHERHAFVSTALVLRPPHLAFGPILSSPQLLCLNSTSPVQPLGMHQQAFLAEKTPRRTLVQRSFLFVASEPYHTIYVCSAAIHPIQDSPRSLVD